MGISYTDEIGQRICARLAEGESLSRICSDEDMPAKSTVVRWASDANHPLAEQYARAREVGYLLLADEIIDISDNSTNDFMDRQKGEEIERVLDHEAIARTRLRIDSRKWMLSKMLPKVYGDKVQVDQTIGFTQEFEAFVRELRGHPAAKVINGLATASGSLEAEPARLRAGGSIQADARDVEPVDTGNAATGDGAKGA